MKEPEIKIIKSSNAKKEKIKRYAKKFGLYTAIVALGWGSLMTGINYFIFNPESVLQKPLEKLKDRNIVPTTPSPWYLNALWPQPNTEQFLETNDSLEQAVDEAESKEQTLVAFQDSTTNKTEIKKTFLEELRLEATEEDPRFKNTIKYVTSALADYNKFASSFYKIGLSNDIIAVLSSAGYQSAVDASKKVTAIRREELHALESVVAAGINNLHPDLPLVLPLRESGADQNAIGTGNANDLGSNQFNLKTITRITKASARKNKAIEALLFKEITNANKEFYGKKTTEYAKEIIFLIENEEIEPSKAFDETLPKTMRKQIGTVNEKNYKSKIADLIQIKAEDLTLDTFFNRIISHKDIIKEYNNLNIDKNRLINLDNTLRNVYYGEISTDNYSTVVIFNPNTKKNDIFGDSLFSRKEYDSYAQNHLKKSILISERNQLKNQTTTSNIKNIYTKIDSIDSKISEIQSSIDSTSQSKKERIDYERGNIWNKINDIETRQRKIKGAFEVEAELHILKNKEVQNLAKTEFLLDVLELNDFKKAVKEYAKDKKVSITEAGLYYIYCSWIAGYGNGSISKLHKMHKSANYNIKEIEKNRIAEYNKRIKNNENPYGYWYVLSRAGRLYETYKEVKEFENLAMFQITPNLNNEAENFLATMLYEVEKESLETFFKRILK